jgi:small conductance mechanosensitive channel
MDVEAVRGNSQVVVETAVEIVSNWGLQVLGAILLLVIGRWAASLISRALRRTLERTGIDEQLIPFCSSAAYYVVLGLVGVAVLQLFGIETTSLVAMIGAASLAVGLALQGTLSSLAAGVMLLVFRPFKIGDYVEVGGSSGSVREIGLFTTTLHTSGNLQVLIPNSAVYGKTITNYSANETRRVDVGVGIGYADDIGAATRIIEEMLAADERVLEEPAPAILVGELAASSVDLIVRAWCERGNYGALRSDLLRALKEKLEAGGCSIPFPQRDVHLISGPPES